MYLVAFQYVFSSPQMALAFTGTFVIISQIKINVTNAYAGSIAWSNFFSRLTHSHPGRVVWLVFNVAIALHADGARHLPGARAHARAVFDRRGGLGRRARRRSRRQQAAGAEPARHRVQARPSLRHQSGRRRRHDRRRPPPGIRGFSGVFGTTLQALAASSRLAPPSSSRPRSPRRPAASFTSRARRGTLVAASDAVRCCHLRASISSPRTWRIVRPIPGRSARCAARSRRAATTAASRRRGSPTSFRRWFGAALPARIVRLLNTHVGQYLGVLLLFVGVIGAVLSLVYFQISFDIDGPRDILASTLWTVFFILTHHRRRSGVGVRARAGKPPRRRGGNAAPDRAADAGDRGA